MNWDEHNFLKCKQDVEDWKIGNNLYQCPFCQKQSTKIGIILHVKIHFGYKHKIKGHEAWNKGLTAETDERVKKYVTTLKEKQSNKTEKSKYKKLSPEKEKARRLKLSEAMKKAHKEKRAWNIGKSRWNNEKSYPEKFLERVLKNHVIDLNYITEYPFYIYSLDFAWPHLKKCIEIDGEQHFRFEEYKQRDICKNELLLQNGWIVLRIRYKDFYNNTKEYIEKIINFIDFNNNDFLLETYYQHIQQEIQQKIEYKKQKEINVLHEKALKINEVLNIVDFKQKTWQVDVSNILNIKKDCVTRWMCENLPNIYHNKECWHHSNYYRYKKN